MLFKKDKQDETERTLSIFERPFRKVLAILISTMMLAGLGMNEGFAISDEHTGLLTIFHIYSDGEYVGVLSDEKKLEQLKAEELQKAASEFENLPLTIATDLSVIPERVFTAEVDDEIVLEKLHDMLSVEAEAVSIIIDGEPAFYVNDMAAYDEVIRKLKLQSVTEKELNEFEARTKSSESIPALKDNETRIANILMSSEIQPVADKTAPNEVRTVEEAVVLLNKGTLEQKNYIVKSGDVLGTIAAAHDMTTAKLLELNPGLTVDTVLQLEDELNVTVIEPYVEVEVHYETRQKEVIPHKVRTEEDSSVYKGEKKVTQEGKDGEKDVTRLIRKRNGKTLGSSVIEEEILVEATDAVTVVGTKVMPSRGTGSFVWPTVGGYVSSQMGTRWGRTHQGIDIARPSARTIKAADNGVVTAAGWQGAYGNRIVITHNNGYETLYAHLSSIDVKVGQTVPQGTAIGIMGSTGRSTGVHLHFEVMKSGANINPMSVLR
ncbi:peptidoglycan DD-metalloendopeptidase family protein [Sporosarcina sp. YIM B06819]|uniref:peptidoglycan DD-metalloendopeptidase family protein n=1 Tax=Sporosarcina sp. YIM B06819 TaxID=3081769 RepID=UPI00298C723C|nr:peptidoglycan DD-metalloendopeptidase family protein [Sporosarcina sp. YIM B06819]